VELSTETEPPQAGRRARWRGALAGVVPTLAIALVFVVGRTTAAPVEIALSMFLVALISVTAGWIAGPLAAGRPRRLLVASIGYALAYIGASVVLSTIQAAWDTWITDGFAPLAVAAAVLGRALYGLAAIAYLIVPALALGLAWSLAARGLMRLDRLRPRPADAP
jgi:hypothetical protein